MKRKSILAFFISFNLIIIGSSITDARKKHVGQIASSYDEEIGTKEVAKPVVASLTTQAETYMDIALKEAAKIEAQTEKPNSWLQKLKDIKNYLLGGGIAATALGVLAYWLSYKNQKLQETENELAATQKTLEDMERKFEQVEETLRIAPTYQRPSSKSVAKSEKQPAYEINPATKRSRSKEMKAPSPKESRVETSAERSIREKTAALEKELALPYSSERISPNISAEIEAGFLPKPRPKQIIEEPKKKEKAIYKPIERVEPALPILE